MQGFHARILLAQVYKGVRVAQVMQQKQMHNKAWPEFRWVAGLWLEKMIL